MDESNKLVSIITPAYNIEKYLNEYFESIINQTYHNWELYIIDDGSTDQSGGIIHEWSNKDARIHAFFQENQGISAARNVGIEKCCGEILTFIDGDDYIAPDFLEKMLYEMNAESVDIVKCGYYKLYKDACIPAQKTLQEKKILSSMEYLRLFYTYPGSYAMVFKSIYKRDVFNGVRFRKGILNEDADITYSIYSKPLKIASIPEPLYFYRRRKSSVMGERNERLALSGSEWVKRQLVLLEEENLKDLYFMALKLYIYTLAENYCYRSKNNRRIAKVEINNAMKKILLLSNYSLKIKTKLLFIRTFPKWYSLRVKNRNISNYIYWE